jgi:hypothetical protein
MISAFAFLVPTLFAVTTDLAAFPVKLIKVNRIFVTYVKEYFDLIN